MRSVSASSARFPHLVGNASALRRFAAECGAVAACLLAYMSALVLIAITAAVVLTHWDFAEDIASLHLDHLVSGVDPPQGGGWRPVAHAAPAFAVSQFDMTGITATYEVLRHPEDGRRDILRWTAADQPPVVGLRIDRPGVDLSPSASATVLAEAGLTSLPRAEAHAAGSIESKFGPVQLFSLTDHAGTATSCLGFAKVFDRPSLRMAGWSCQGETAAARRRAIGCLLNRLVLLNASGDARLAELFARAELRRRDCALTPLRETVDWMVGAQNPSLRGAL